MIEIGENGFMKENFKTIPWNQKSSNLTFIAQRNQRSKRGVFSEIENHELSKIKLKIKLNYLSKWKLNTQT